MVNLNDYKEYSEELLEVIGADRLVMVVQEEHLKKRLRDDTGIILAVVYPSIVGTGNADNTRDNNTVLLFVLEYAGKSTMTDSSEFDSYEKLQALAGMIKDKIIADSDGGHELMMNLDRTSIEIEPEYNIAGSYNGWLVAFSFES